MTSTVYEQLLTVNQYILKPFVVQLTLSQGHNYMEFLWLITPSSNIFLFLIWNDLPLGSTTTVLFRTTFTRTIKLNLLLKWLLGSNLLQTILNSKHRIGFGFYHRQPNNNSIKGSCLKTHDNKFVNSFFLLCLSLQIMPHLLLRFYHHPHQWYHLPHHLFKHHT